MGSTFALFLAKVGPARGADAVLELAETDRYELADAEEAPVRTIVVRSAGEDHWTAVDDDLLYGANAATLGRSAARLSARVVAPVVAASVLDSDVTTLVLATDGEVSQAVNVGPAAERTPASPSPEWRSVMLRRRTIDDLWSVWLQPVVFAEQVLVAMAPLFGWDPRLPARGEWAPDDQGVHERVIRLRPASAGTSGGPPSLGHAGGDHQVQARPGEMARVTAVAHSTGGQGTGLTVTVWGPALDAGLLVVRRATVTVAQPPAATAVGDLRTSGGGELVATTSVLDLPIPPGVSDQRAAFAGVPTAEGARRWLATRIEAVIDVEAGRVGREDLYIALVPAHNREGAAVWSVEAVVASPG